MPVEDSCCMTPDRDSVVSGELVVETHGGTICSWPTKNRATPITIGEEPTVDTADPVEEIFPSSTIIATDVREELIARAEPAPRLLDDPHKNLGSGKPLVTSPLIALAPLGDTALIRAQQALTAAVPLVLPPSRRCTVHSSDQPPPFVAPPPSSAAPSRRAAVLKLLAASGQPPRRASALGCRIFKIGLFSRLPDRCFVDIKSGIWSDLGRALLGQHLLGVSALRPRTFYLFPASRPPPKPPPHPRKQ